MKKILWIASYPKSGNTWLRAIITSLLYTSKGEFNFPLLKLIEIFEKKSRFKFIKNLNLNDFNLLDKPKYISKYWQLCQEQIVNNKEIKPTYNILKTHSANLTLNSNNFVSPKFTGGLIYIVRDPREIVVSFSKHRGRDYDDTIDLMTDKGALLTEEYKLSLAVISSWDIHYKSWKMLKTPTLLIKYEDLINKTNEEIEKICYFLSKILDLNKQILINKIDNTVKTTKIEKLRKHEAKYGFDEATKHSSFFGKAKVNSWSDKLSDKQILNIENSFKETLNKLGYL